MTDQFVTTLSEALEPLLRRLAREEGRRAGLEWRWLTAERAGGLLGISAAAVRQRVRRGQLPGRHLGGRVYLDFRDLDATIENGGYDASSFRSTKWGERRWNGPAPGTGGRSSHA
jgi:hypothetical protein